MVVIRKSIDRGHVDHGWLNARHSFSFGNYQDPDWMGFGTLRVINEDVISPRMGFGEHGHRDMEIITYPISGAIRHRDSLGNEQDIVHGMIQRMSAGSGIRHSEFNPLNEETHLLQIWIEPREKSVNPSHESKQFPILEETGRLHLLASESGEDGSLKIEQDARMHAGVFNPGDSLRLDSNQSRKLWVQLVQGTVKLSHAGIDNENNSLRAGDAIGISDSETVELAFIEPSEVLVFELS
ncbi:MAG: pirin family protein [Phycisphaerales bacterium]|nr:pirin family protein [Phycisphaerales bacterium]